MSPIESIIYMIWRGIAIGILISAPMGPVGILCIQRTLDKGRKAGLYTGIGAAISDLFYCLLTGFGLSFIEGFLNENQNVIQLIGSIVLIAFSIYLFRKNPSSSMRRPVPQNVSVKKNILGGFLFTFSNPLIIFLIIGLFARFNFTIPEIKGYYYAIGYLFIIIGALLWWYGITYIIDKVRLRFNMRSMKRLNNIIGIVILGFACVGIVTSIMGLFSNDCNAQTTVNKENPLNPEFLTNQTDSLFFENLISNDDGGGLIAGQLDFKLANRASSPMRSYHYFDSSGSKKSSKLPPWGVKIKGEKDSLLIAVRIIEYSPNHLESLPAAEFDIFPHADTFFSGALKNSIVSAGLNTGNEFNHYRLLWDSETLTLRGGNHKLSTIFDLPKELGNITDVSLCLYPGSSVNLKELRFKVPDFPGKFRASYNLEDIEKRLHSTSDPLEKVWKIYDINLNDKYLAKGGDYLVALIKAPDSSYDIIYLDGASINARDWKRGMLKGRLKFTGIQEVFDLEWIDPFGSRLTNNLKARLLSEDELSLQFPFHDSSLILKALD